MVEYYLNSVIKRKNMFSVKVGSDVGKVMDFDIPLSKPLAVGLDDVPKKLNKVLKVSQYRNKKIKVCIKGNKIVDVEVPES